MVCQVTFECVVQCFGCLRRYVRVLESSISASASKVQQDIGGRGRTHASCMTWMDTRTVRRRGTAGTGEGALSIRNFPELRTMPGHDRHIIGAWTYIPHTTARERLHPRIRITNHPRSSAAVSSPHVPRIASPPHPFSNCALPPRHSPVHRATPHFPLGGSWHGFPIGQTKRPWMDLPRPNRKGRRCGIGMGIVWLVGGLGCGWW
jgi:hypothetical protein